MNSGISAGTGEEFKLKAGAIVSWQVAGAPMRGKGRVISDEVDGQVLVAVDTLDGSPNPGYHIVINCTVTWLTIEAADVCNCDDCRRTRGETIVPPLPTPATKITSVRAKFRCDNKSDPTTDGSVQTILLYAVCDADPNSENGRFFKYTPTGTLTLGVVTPEVGQAFEIGKEYYIDISPAIPVTN